MAERYKPESVQGRIARVVESRAGKEWGPEKGLTREVVARALNLESEAISEEAWHEISEFAINAGAAIQQAAIDKDLSKEPKDLEEGLAYNRIFTNEDNLDPKHDLFHAAETYRLSAGRDASARFAEVGERERYTDPTLIASEFWPLLFGIVPAMRAPLSVLLYSPAGRNAVADYFTRNDALTVETRKELREMLSNPPPTEPREVRNEYEHLIELLYSGTAKNKVPDVTPEELDAIQKATRIAIENPSPLYDAFATRVFDEEWRDNPRLFLDELLAAIRTKPEIKPE